MLELTEKLESEKHSKSIPLMPEASLAPKESTAKAHSKALDLALKKSSESPALESIELKECRKSEITETSSRKKSKNSRLAVPFAFKKSPVF